MIIIRVAGDEAYFAASRKAVPALVQEIAVKIDDLIEETIERCAYFEFNTRESRSGELGPFQPLSGLVVVNCGLAPQADQDDEEEENGEA